MPGEQCLASNAWRAMPGEQVKDWIWKSPAATIRENAVYLRLHNNEAWRLYGDIGGQIVEAIVQALKSPPYT